MEVRVQKWEYCSLTWYVTQMDAQNAADLKLDKPSVSIEDSPTGLKLVTWGQISDYANGETITVGKMGAALKLLGEDGWEMITAFSQKINDGPGIMQMQLFKRPIES
jgi:hypothetical protein